MCIIQTGYGPIRGVHEGNLYSFMGVPYARPPVGQLRFRPAQKPETWTETLDCTCPRPMAMQRADETDNPGEPYYTDFFFAGLPKQSEDCLYLNVTTCDLKGKKPVYMWFHGGALHSGFSYEPEFNPEAFAEKGIVVVSVAQRLNIFCYLSLPQLDEDRCQSGNYGLTDQLQAFEWVCENIANFGGDPDNITIGGQSGGTTKSIALAIACHSADAGRVPRRIIVESGIKWRFSFTPKNEADENGKAYLTSIGLDENMSAEELRRLPAQRLMSKGNRLMPGTMTMNPKLFRYASVREASEAGMLDHTDMIVGLNLGEANVPSVQSEDDLMNFWTSMLGSRADAEELRKTLGEELSPADAARLMGTYGLCEDAGPNQSRNLMVAREFAGFIHARGGPARIYVYLFTRYPTSAPDDHGPGREWEKLWAWHAGELWYSFQSLREGVPPVRPWEKADFDLAACMNDYWTNFMYTGDPSDGPRSVRTAWPECRGSGTYIQLDEAVTVHDTHFTDSWTRDYVRRAFRFEGKAGES